MLKRNHDAGAQHSIRRLISDHRTWSLAIFAAITLLLACAPASYTNDVSERSAGEAQASFTGQ